MKNLCRILAVALAWCLVAWGSAGEAAERKSPEWVTKLPAAKQAKQILIVAGVGESTAWISMHERNEDKEWRQIISTPGFIGVNGLEKDKEWNGKTPVGTFKFNRAFGLEPDPGCAIPYVQVTDDHYWSCDPRPGMKYNQLVSIKDLPSLNVDVSEHLINFVDRYDYCLNISYNEAGVPGVGTAIFLGCLDEAMPFTGGGVAIPKDKMLSVMQRVRPDCVVIIDSLKNLGGRF